MNKGEDFSIITGSGNFEIVPILFSNNAPLDQEAEALWQNAVARNEHLFDGCILDVAEISGSTISVRVISYRSFLTHRLRGGSDIKPLGVSGYIFREGRLLTGRRPLAVTQYAGYTEALPSGSVDWIQKDGVISARDTLITELKEEVGLHLDADSFGTPALIFDSMASTFDLCFRINTDLSSDGLLDQVNETGHYGNVAWTSVDDLLSMQNVVPTTSGIATNLKRNLDAET